MKKFVAIVALLTGIGIVAVVAIGQIGGQPLSTDLTAVGGGVPALVLAHENYSPASMAAASEINFLRREFGGDLVFIAADIGVPEGQQFAARHALVSGQAILLAGDGTPLGQFDPVTDSDRLLAQLAETVSSAP